ncbi:MAG TPA: type II toxin-antitoxin system VapC family toxin [bacterium]|nr:type II toxin-antitoxin system VapC family toxin [bacterium]
MKFLLDTHALLWWLVNDPQLSVKARRVIADRRNEIFVSSASAWEIATKHRLGKMKGMEEVAEHLSFYVGKTDFSILEISFEHAQTAGSLPGPHRDLFDRMLIAQSILENMPIVTLDSVFEGYRARVVW